MAELRTFVLVYENKIISPELVTVRDYASYLESTFNETICHQHLYMNSKKADGNVACEWHPGTRLGNYFDHGRFVGVRFHSWYIPNDGKAMKQLTYHNIAELRDCNKYSGKQMLRVYTTDQIQAYIKFNIDGSYTLTTLEPKQIVLSKSDMEQLIQPKTQPIRRLF